MDSHGESEKQRATKELLHRALDLPRAERQGFLAANLPPGQTLQGALDLVEGVEELDGFLETPFARPESFTPALPKYIGPYTVERVLGWGSMGVVYLARQAEPSRAVAVKLLRVDTTGESTPARFRREADLLAQLSHPGIATVYEAGVMDLGAGEQPWFSMEFVEGVSLTTYAEMHDLDQRARVQLLCEAARAVQYAHEKGVVHRDLKPENLLVRGDGTPCVLDFGVASTVADSASLLTLTATGQVLGTLAYMAPEQARGGDVTFAADQYALGAMLYELLTGELPLPVRGRHPIDALRVVADGAWTPPTRHDATLAGDLEAILATALAPEANRRYASVGELADDLERWLDGRPVHARPPSPLAGLARQLRKHPLVAVSVAVALLVLGAFLTIALEATLQRDREGEVSLLFSDRALHASLVAQAGELQPFGGTPTEQFDTWLESASELLGRLDRHRVASRAFVDRPIALETTVGTELGDDWLLEQAQELVEVLEDFGARGGLLEDLRERRDHAATLRARTVDEHAEVWVAAARRVASDTRFAGLVLRPQLGLVPLGADPDSGLEEFAVLGTGRVPQRGEGKGRVGARVGDGIVLVLVPGGESLIGVQTADPEAANHAPLADETEGHEGPPVRTRLDPFLIGKFEASQDLWVRLTGVNPSDWEVGSVIEGTTIGPLHPVESLSWQDARKTLSRFALVLPTEARWEVAARGASPWARVHGAEPRDLVGYVNANTHQTTYQELPPGVTDDGCYPSMPVGRLEPNAFGLHDMLGNVWELCLDTYKVDYHTLEHREGDGLVIAEPDGDVTRRGGCCALRLALVNVYRRQMKRFDGRDTMTGLRPARALVFREP